MANQTSVCSSTSSGTVSVWIEPAGSNRYEPAVLTSGYSRYFHRPEIGEGEDLTGVLVARDRHARSRTWCAPPTSRPRCRPGAAGCGCRRRRSRTEDRIRPDGARRGTVDHTHAPQGRQTGSPTLLHRLADVVVIGAARWDRRPRGGSRGEGGTWCCSSSSSRATSSDRAMAARGSSGWRTTTRVRAHGAGGVAAVARARGRRGLHPARNDRRGRSRRPCVDGRGGRCPSRPAGRATR